MGKSDRDFALGELRNGAHVRVVVREAYSGYSGDCYVIGVAGSRFRIDASVMTGLIRERLVCVTAVLAWNVFQYEAAA